ESGAVERVGDPADRALLLEAELRMRVDAMRERDEVRARGVEPFAGGGFRVHRPIVLTLEAQRQYDAAMYDGLRVIDADAHKMENPVVFFDSLEAPSRARLGSRVDRWGQQRLVIRDVDPATGRPDLERVFPQPDGPGKGAFAAIHPETAIGGVFNRIRLEHMDREGVDTQVLYGSMTLSFEAIVDRDLAVACMRAYNDYMAD